jgi:RNA polymerase sigma-70 factor (ECF subfamily)
MMAMAHERSVEGRSLMSDDSDEQLLTRLRQRDEAAFEMLFVRYYGRVYRVLYRLIGTREGAEDLAQETFMALYDHPPRLAAGTSLAAWLCRVALNRGYNALRTERRAWQRIERTASTAPQSDPHTEALRAEERARVVLVLGQLPERQGKLLVLRHAGLSYAEIAEALEVAPGSIGTLLVRAERAFVTAYRQIEPVEQEDQLDTRVS